MVNNNIVVDAVIIDVIIIRLAAMLCGSRPGGAIRIAHYDVIDDVITRKL